MKASRWPTSVAKIGGGDHRNRVQVSRLISIKTGACPEDCSYCPQSAHYATGLEKEKLLAVEEVVESARQAKEEGASRFCSTC